MSHLRRFRFDLFLVVVNALLGLPNHGLRLWVLRHVAGVQVGARCAIQRHIRIRGRGGVVVGDGTNINAGVLLDGGGGLTIGNRVNVSPEVLLLTTEHDPDDPAFSGRSASVSVGDRAWLATRAIILPGADIGEGSIVAAGAVVRGKVEPWSIVAGNPAQVIGERDRRAQSELPRYLRWWH